MASLLRLQTYRRWLIACTAARLPLTMVVLAMVLAGRRLGSFSLGAEMAGIATAALGLGALWRGRRLDRSELRHGLRRDALLLGGGSVAVAVLVQLRAPGLVVAAMAAAACAAGSGLMAGYRALLPAVVPVGETDKAYAVDAVNVELAFVAGPALAGGLAYIAGPVGVLLAMGAFAMASAALTSSLPDRHPVEHTGEGLAPPPWQTTAAKAVFASAAGVGIMVGLLETSIAPLSVQLGEKAAFAGILMAAYALGSGLGGLAIGTRLAGRGDPTRRAVIFLALIGLLVVPISVAPSAPVAVIMMIACGLPFASASGVASTVLATVVSPSRITEGFALFTASVMGGVALGDALASVLLDQVSPRFVVALGALPVLAVFGAIAPFVLSRRRYAAEPTPT